MDKDVNALSLWDSGGSNDDRGSNCSYSEFSSLRLHSSLDSNRSGKSDQISRGKGTGSKSNSTNQIRPKNKPTSKFVLEALKQHESIQSSGYFSISPTSENEVLNTQSFEISNVFSNNMAYNDNPRYPQRSTMNAKKIVQTNLMHRMFNRIKKHDIIQWKFDHGDTQLIKCCRCGQIQEVKEALTFLKDHEKLKLIDHQNMSNQTALSIATNSMNEVLIELLLMNGASPEIPLIMGNNVLHIAAAMTLDSERKTYWYLIKGIMRCGKFDKLLDTINAKNIYNFDPIEILILYRNANEADNSIYNCLQHHINESIQIRKCYQINYKM